MQLGPAQLLQNSLLRVNDPKTIKIIQNIPVQRMGQPEDVAHAVASLLDDRAGFITGQIHFVCGGMTVGLSNAT